MGDDIAARRLRKKVLDRWENEGGKIATDPVQTDRVGTKNDREGKTRQLPESHAIKTTGDPNPPAKTRKPK